MTGFLVPCIFSPESLITKNIYAKFMAMLVKFTVPRQYKESYNENYLESLNLIGVQLLQKQLCRQD